MSAFSEPVIDAAALARLLGGGREEGAPDVVVVDCRFDLADANSGRRQYLAGHLPGAVYAHLDHDLSDHASGGGGRHPLPSPSAIATRLGALGIGGGSAVVAYDQGGGAFAARLWWMLRFIGHSSVAVLDGGLPAWQAAGGSLQPGESRLPLATLVARADAAMLVAADAVSRFARIVDSRDGARYRGDHEPIDPVAGHIPGAVHRFFGANLDESGRFRPAAALHAEFSALLGGVAPADSVFYCGSGVTACHNLLAMERAGLPMARLYAGSWSEWCSDAARPVARGESA